MVDHDMGAYKPRRPQPSRQLPLALEFETTYELTDFLVAPCNAKAATAILNWPLHAHALVIYGPRGCGKTHLLRAWSIARQAEIVEASDLDQINFEACAESPRDYAIENIETCTRETSLLHLYNMTLASGKKLLLTASCPPSQWQTLRLPDLVSRLRSVPIHGIDEPDDSLLSALIIKIAADHRLKIPEELISYMISRVERSFDAVTRLVSLIDRISLSSHGRVTLAIVRQALMDI